MKKAVEPVAKDGEVVMHVYSRTRPVAMYARLYRGAVCLPVFLRADTMDGLKAVAVEHGYSVARSVDAVTGEAL